MGVKEPDVAPGVGMPQSRFIATETASLLQRLLALDDLWTAELQQAAGRGRLSENDVLVLQALVDEVERGLEQAPRRVEEVRLMLEEAGDEHVDQAFRLIGESEAIPPRLIDEFQAELGDFELRSAAMAGCEYIKQKAGDEAALYREKLAVIVQSEEVPPGDFLMPFRCAALIALVGAGTVSVIGLGGPVGFVALGATSSLGLGAFAWIEAKCGVHLPEISFGRR